MRGDKTFFTDREKVQAFADSLNTKTRSASVQPDEEHQAHGIVIEDRTGGYPKYHRVDLDFVTTSEFRTLATSYQDVKDIKGPMIVKTTGAGVDNAADDAAADEAGQAAAGRHRDRRRHRSTTPPGSRRSRRPRQAAAPGEGPAV